MGDEKKTSLDTMIDNRDTFLAQGKMYTVLPVKIKEIPELKKDNLAVQEKHQGYNLLSDEKVKKIDKWLTKKLLNENDDPMSYEKISEADWDTNDLSNFLNHLYKVSG